MLAVLLRRKSPSPVAQIVDGMRVERKSVDVIPSGHDRELWNGALRRLEPALPRGLRLPIDTCFRLLAVDRRQQSVGVVLSGMGSAGTLGLRARSRRASPTSSLRWRSWRLGS